MVALSPGMQEGVIAADTIISAGGMADVGKFCLGTDGSGARNLIINSGGIRCLRKQNDLSFDENGNPYSCEWLRVFLGTTTTN